jgi:hypothetical protein
VFCNGLNEGEDVDTKTLTLIGKLVSGAEARKPPESVNGDCPPSFAWRSGYMAALQDALDLATTEKEPKTKQ